MKTILVSLLALLCIPAFAEEPAPAQMKLFLLIGQSNMAGRGKVEPQDQVMNPKPSISTPPISARSANAMPSSI